MTVLKETDFKGLGDKQAGKVRDIYVQAERIILVSTDRHSSFDRIIAHIPHKGQVLNQLTAFWFERTKDIVENHALAVPDPNVVVARRCTPLPIEMVVRGYITGVTGTALWTLYQGGQRDFGNFVLPEGMRKNQRLDTPVLTPTTKSEVHDRPITPAEIVSEALLSQALWDEVASYALRLFARGQDIAKGAGLILVDTKYEFGTDGAGNVVLIDEIHTPDSSRYWQDATYEERIREGLEPENFDKEFLRLWFKDHCDPYKDTVLPDAPRELIMEMSRRYTQIFEQITGTAFAAPPESADVVERIKNNLKPYYVA